jgi:hypothetical protein
MCDVPGLDKKRLYHTEVTDSTRALKLLEEPLMHTEQHHAWALQSHLGVLDHHLGNLWLDLDHVLEDGQHVVHRRSLLIVALIQ